VIYIILSVITKNYGFFFIWGYIKNFFHRKKVAKAITTREVESEDVNVENESSEKSDDSKGDLEN
jgi:hypothetical protein